MAPQHTPTEQDPPADRSAADAQYYRRVLQELDDIGRKLGCQLPATPAGSDPTLDATCYDDSDAEDLLDDLFEELDEPEFDDDIADRPIADVIAEICRDLGIVAIRGTPPRARRAPADITILRPRAASHPSGTTQRQEAAAILPFPTRFRGKP